MKKRKRVCARKRGRGRERGGGGERERTNQLSQPAEKTEIFQIISGPGRQRD